MHIPISRKSPASEAAPQPAVSDIPGPTRPPRPGGHGGVSIVKGVPPNGWFIREKPIKMEDD